MAYTQAQLDSLRKVMSSGAESVRFTDKGVTYRSLEELRELERRMERDINGAPPASNTIGIRSGKGL